MGKPKTSKEEVAEIVRLRKSGLSLDGICKLVPRGKTTIYSYIKNVKVDFDLRKTGSIRRAEKDWEKSKITAGNLISRISPQSEILILASLYWAEGSKGDLNLINSDPDLIRIFVSCLKKLGVETEDLLVTARIYEDLSPLKVKSFWAKTLGIPVNLIRGVNILHGKKSGKLKHGMCRVRVKKGAKYFKIIMSVIDLMKSKL
jgi:hypothetical protein